MRTILKTVLIFGVLLALSLSASAGAIQVMSTSYNPTPAAPGQLITVWVSIKNNSQGISENVRVTPRMNYPFSVGETGQNQIVFGSIAPFQTVSGKLDIQIDKEALNGTYELEIESKEGPLSGILTKLSVQVLSFKPKIEIVSGDTLEALPGQTIHPALQIKNIGSSNAINVLIGTLEDRTVTSTGVIVERAIKTVGPSLQFIDTLAPAETKTISLTLGVDSDAEQKTHLVPITIKYQDENRSEFEETRYLGVRVNAQAELDAYFSYDGTAKPYPGGQSNITVNLFNQGTATGQNIVVEITESDVLDILSEKKVFIGTLDPDDFDSFKLEARIKTGTAPGRYPVTIQFDFKNQDNQSQTVSQTIYLDVFNQADATGAGAQAGSVLDWVIPLAIILVIGYFGYKRFFKKNKK